MIEPIVLACEALGPVRVVRASGREAMNELPRWTVDVLAEEGALDLAMLIGADAELAFADDDGAVRTIALVVTRAAYAGSSRDGHRYEVELSSRLFWLTLRSGRRIFQELTTQQIVARVLEDAGVPRSEIAFRLSGRYGIRIHCVQYDETEWDFLRRLLADEGINVWFDATDDGAPLVVFGDGPSSHESIPGPMTLRFEDASGMSRTARALHSLRRTYSLTHDKVHVRDFDMRQPDVLVEATAGQGPFEHFEFPANVVHAEAAQARAQVRLEQLSRHSIRVTAESSCARITPGRILRVEGASDEVLEGEHLVTEVEHAITQATRNASEARPYANRVVMVPHGGKAFRPDLPRAAPRIDALETAVVTGPPGEEIHVDDLGCVKLRFHWDRSGIEDDRSSRWVRTLQMNMHGSMLLPRVGWEVPVAYVDGDPDQPVALGRLYNGGAPAPYGLPARKATTTFQSATSPGGGSTHELRLADDAGSMEAFIHATKDQTVNVGGTYTKAVSVDMNEDVGKSKVLTVHGNQTTTVGGSQSVTVGADASITVAGARTEAIGGMESIGVTGTYLTEVKGAYTEVVGGVYGLECNQSNSTIQGAFTQMIGGPMVLTAGLGTNNTVAAMRNEDVGGARTFTAAAGYADSTKGAKSVTAGAATEHAGTDHVTNAGVVSISVGGSASWKAGGAFAIEAPSISIEVAGSITADGGGGVLKIGGDVEVASGKVKFAASTTAKKATSKVG